MYTQEYIRLALHALLGISGYRYANEIITTKGLYHTSYIEVVAKARNLNTPRNFQHKRLIDFYYWTDEPINR